MTERHSDTLQYFVVPGAQAEEADGSPAKPFSSLSEALARLRQVQRQFLSTNGTAAFRRQFEIVFPGRDGRSVRPGRSARHQYYVDPRGGGPQGDGSELVPWPDFDTAFQQIEQRHETGKLKLTAGRRLRISERAVFTATRYERRRQLREFVAKYTFLAMALLLVVPVVAILGYLTVQAWPALTVEFLLENSDGNMTAGGIWAPLIGTFFLVLLSLLLAAPVGVLAGVYLNEYARDNWMTRIINLAVVNLAGVPSIVHGLFGVGAFVLFMKLNRSLLAASCTVAVMTLPVIITSTRESLAAVPMPFREACWNMGASKWQTIRTIVLPNSISGILTGVILQVARAAGETAPILFTGAMMWAHVADTGLEAWIPYGPGDKFMALSYHLFISATQIQGIPDSMQYGTAVVLVGLVLVVNSVSIGLRLYLRVRKKW